jgi:hypothetical protein
MNGLEFAQGTDGKWGYKVAGADPVIPFNNLSNKTLLWTNPSPAGYQSAFSISADFSKYNLFEINAAYSVFGGTPSGITKSVVLKNETNSIGAGNPYTMGRTVSISDTQISFGIGTASSGTASYYCVPQTIYGIC